MLGFSPVGSAPIADDGLNSIITDVFGTIDLVLLSSATSMVGLGLPIGTVDLTFVSAPTISGSVPFTGSSSIYFANNGTVLGQAGAVGSAWVDLIGGGTMAANATISGSTDLTIDTESRLTMIYYVDGEGFLVFASNGDAKASAAASGNSSIALTENESSMIGSGSTAGSTTSTFNLHGVQTGSGALGISLFPGFTVAATSRGDAAAAAAINIAMQVAGQIAGLGGVVGSSSIYVQNHGLIGGLGSVVSEADLKLLTGDATASGVGSVGAVNQFRFGYDAFARASAHAATSTPIILSPAASILGHFPLGGHLDFNVIASTSAANGTANLVSPIGFNFDVDPATVLGSGAIASDLIAWTLKSAAGLIGYTPIAGSTTITVVVDGQAFTFNTTDLLRDIRVRLIAQDRFNVSDVNYPLNFMRVVGIRARGPLVVNGVTYPASDIRLGGVNNVNLDKYLATPN